ncbi:hypothetical protein NPS42_25880 [Pseudomonas putida]|uniref:hypothetical protein n=1 Tax=Pseudomonas putida TaxID=303 RepID=UPI00236482E9|nr:hypothetical protein [Pseudomonas putida]MDD2029217.1 hypothetical protein [Pseudomonas putida]HDS1769537.1 hypothetical protein [Pseudomonas putida]
MSTIGSGSVGSLVRSKTLFHAAAQSMGCSHTVYSMAKYWRTVRPWNDSLSLWRRLRCGMGLNQNNQSLLFDHLPQLRSLFDNPLWLAITHPEWVKEWDELAESIRVGGKPLGAYNGQLSRLLYDRVDWPCLAVHLVLLQTQSRRFEFHRMWLEQHFAAMAGLCCIQRPISYIRTELQDFLFPTLFGTEAPSQADRQCCLSSWAANEALFEFLQRRKWLHGNDQHLALLIWNFRQQLQHELDVGPPLSMEATVCGLPHSLRKKWFRKLSQWMDHPVHLNGFCCELSNQYA